jgi:hypothetical protein
MGKGRKMRAVPLMDTTAQILRDYLRDNGLDRPEHFDRPLFQNRQGRRLSRSGVRYILEKYVSAVRSNHPGFTQPVSPHCLRHTKGMHLLQSGVPLEIIRDFLGHVDVKTTQIYARANLEMKRKALEKVTDVSPLPKIPSWKQDKSNRLAIYIYSSFRRSAMLVLTTIVPAQGEAAWFSRKQSQQTRSNSGPTGSPPGGRAA